MIFYKYFLITDVIEKNSHRYVGEFLSKNNLSIKDLPKHSKCIIDEDI